MKTLKEENLQLKKEKEETELTNDIQAEEILNLNNEHELEILNLNNKYEVEKKELQQKNDSQEKIVKEMIKKMNGEEYSKMIEEITEKMELLKKAICDR